MCDGCASSVTEALEAAEDAVKEVKVDLEAKKVSVFVACDTMMDGLAMMPQLVEAVQAELNKAQAEAKESHGNAVRLQAKVSQLEEQLDGRHRR